ncbi:MAG TPA: alkaline phosphatase family protein [Actinomycetota bacterium]
MPELKRRPSPTVLLIAALVAAFAMALVIALVGSLLMSIVVGLLILAGGAAIAWRQRDTATDVSRRRFLTTMGATGVGAIVVGSGIGRAVERATKPDPGPTLEAMARNVGAPGMEFLRRGAHADRSGDIQLVLAPWNTSNYSFESLKLEHDDPRSSHAMLWGYTERIPLVVVAPGIVAPSDSTEPVTLADLAPTTAQLMGFPFSTPDGQVLPGVPKPSGKVKVVVTYVIDGGGWNVLTKWGDAWPNLRRMMGEGANFRNATMGSFPSVTACAHATIGTGRFPMHHGISGHNVRVDGHVQKAWGELGHADPSYLLIPTLAMDYADATNHRAWVGEIGYQIWHLGMTSDPGRGPHGELPVAMYWDEDDTDHWQSQNPDLFRMPDGMPPRDFLTERLIGWFGEGDGKKIDRRGKKVCCSPPIVEYQGEIIAQALKNEPIGHGDATSLLYINYKSPDYTGHVVNMNDYDEWYVLHQVDAELGRVRAMLEQAFHPGEWALIVTADHGQCPLVDTAGGVRLDPIQFQEDLASRFGKSVWEVATLDDVKPSEVYLDSRAMGDSGTTAGEIAASFRDYRYGDNIGPYISPASIDRGRRLQREFSGVFPKDFLLKLTQDRTSTYGAGNYPDADPGIPTLG